MFNLHQVVIYDLLYCLVCKYHTRLEVGDSSHVSFIRYIYILLRVMVFNVTFKNTSVVSWLAVLLEEESGVPVENNRLATNQTNFIT
jgi:hypothetical protein